MDLAGKKKALKTRRARGRPTLEDAVEIENKLLAVALRQFLDNGYGGTSMTQIVRAAQISKTTLYSRFSSKEELFRAIMRRQIEELAATTTLVPPDGRLDLETGLRAYANRALDFSMSGDLLGVNRLVYSEARRFPELGDAAAEATQLGIQQISDFIEQCAILDSTPCRDSKGIAEAFLHMLRGWYVNVMLTNRAVALAEREAWVDRAVRTLISARQDW
jgi:AcrR family transcriptional regulator